jgi:hypothetical protein
MSRSTTYSLIASMCSLLMACHNSPKQEITIVIDSNGKSQQVDSLIKPDTMYNVAENLYGPDTYRPAAVATVQQFAQQQYASDLQSGVIDSASRKFQLFEYDVNDDGSKEIFVALNGSYFCGTGGCSFVLLDASGNLISKFTVATQPFVVLPEKKNGYHNLMLYSNKAWRVLVFDGKKYPSNASVLPAAKLLPGDGLPRILNTTQEPYPSFYF